MPPVADLDHLRSIKTLPSLIAYLRDELDWPIEADETEDVTFDYDPEELGFDKADAVHIKEIKQIRPLDAKQPWGIFWVNLEKKRLPVVMLRRILANLVLKKRASANKASQRAWHLNDLLFISAYGEETDRAITFAHFSQDAESPGDLPVLKVLGWDDGVILYDETIRQQKEDGTPFLKVLTDAGIIPGIKVDTGAKNLAGHPGEKITEGLDGLRDRLKEYFYMGARFAKWRAVIA